MHRQLADALERDAVWHLEPPLNDHFMRAKYFALCLFLYVDEGLRFDLGRGNVQRLG